MLLATFAMCCVTRYNPRLLSF
uniref:Uncharacterized protein n=1 Tax=Anguilla anguilla TaxID=7936 RepID=A0A0E9UHM7_ANGAN